MFALYIKADGLAALEPVGAAAETHLIKYRLDARTRTDTPEGERSKEMNLEEATEKRRRNNRLWGALAVFVAVVALVLGTAFFSGGQANPTKAQADSSEESAKAAPEEVSEELKKLLDVAHKPLEEFSCTTIVEKTGGKVVDDAYSLLLATLKGVEKGNTSLRQWSDALSIPLKGKSTKEKRQYVQRAICEEPIIGVSLAHLFAHLEVEGVRVLDLQSTAWLEPYAVQPGEINDLVAGFMPVTQWKLENISKKDVPEDVYVEGVKANHKYQELGSRLNLLLSKYQLGEVLSINSKHHYALKAGGLTADGVPEVKISKEVDSKPALVFYLTKKTDDCKPISVLAFNTGDKRPMLGKIVDSCKELTTPAAKPKPDKPKPGVTPPSKNPPAGPPPGDTPPPPPPPPGPSPKQPSQDPYPQGNAPTGGGNNHNPGPGAKTNPVQPPNTPRENPAPPAPAPPPQSTPDPRPAPAPEPEAPKPSAPETGCVPMLGVTC